MTMWIRTEQWPPPEEPDRPSGAPVASAQKRKEAPDGKRDWRRDPLFDFRLLRASLSPDHDASPAAVSRAIFERLIRYGLHGTYEIGAHLVRLHGGYATNAKTKCQALQASAARYHHPTPGDALETIGRGVPRKITRHFREQVSKMEQVNLHLNNSQSPSGRQEQLYQSAVLLARRAGPDVRAAARELLAPQNEQVFARVLRGQTGRRWRP